ncbi:MAG: nucleotidyl transferase AbiEii/AbiGii toxin family protein, partial [Bacteriovorax sp.]
KFYPQVSLLLDTLPYVAKESCFVLKGGTAINLFVRDFPRLSVDIDLTYLGNEPREDALLKTEQALLRIKSDVEKYIKAKVSSSSRQSQTTDIKLFVNRDGVQIKIEANPVLRGVLYPPNVLSLQNKVSEEFEKDLEIQVSSLPDLYGGKIAAALDRQHPRDLFDVKLLLENEGLSQEIMTGFLVYLMCHQRPPHELLKPTLLDQKALFDSDFKGMTNIEFNYAHFTKTREMLIEKINANLSSDDKSFLLSFFEGAPDWRLFREPHAQDLPAIKWKQINLNKLESEKKNSQLKNLKAIF